ncbi:MAG: ribosomal-processing cysteine protease Prp [Eubacteriaceae bacterium]|nr:ribosomal-processing cysteine protease Prp [Eubacteriaceae bacterium]
MITVTVFRSDGHVDSLFIEGHSDYAEEGEDIVCAGVSSLAVTLANGLTEIAHIPTVECAVEGGFGHIVLAEGLTPAQRAQADLLMNTFTLGFQSLAASYADDVSIIFANGGEQHD